MNYLDLFSGIGGFHEGFKQAGFKFEWSGFSEIDKYAKQIYKKHFSESEDLGDVKSITVDRLPKINLITFGFPCQDLSIAGKRAGLGGQRSGLFSEAIRIIRDASPDYFIFENVKGLFSSNGGRDWLTVLQAIANIGYDGQWQLLDTRRVLPQSRQRIYFIGHIRGQCRPEIFPIREGDKNNDRRGKTKQRKGERIPSGQALCKIGVINKDAQGQRVYDPKGNACQLTSQGGGLGANTGLYFVKRFPLKFINRNQKNIKGDYAFTVDSINASGIKNNHGIRRLTPTECERLQGFEDGWTEGISDSQRYKCLGNAVTVPIVKLIADRLINYVNL